MLHADRKGPINSSDWSLKKDYERILMSSGWSKHQLSALSVIFEIIYFDQSNVRSSDSVRPRNKPTTGSGAHHSTPVIPATEGSSHVAHYSQLCPNNISLRFMAFGREVRSDLVLNKYLHSPNLQVKVISNVGAETRSIKTRDECYYQGREEMPFGTYTIDTKGRMRLVGDSLFIF